MVKSKNDFYDLRTRIFSGLVFGLLAFTSLFYGGLFATLFLSICLVVLSWEIFVIFSKGIFVSSQLLYLTMVIVFFIPILNYYNFYSITLLLCCSIASFFVLYRDLLKGFCILYVGCSVLIFQEILLFDGTTSNYKHLLFVIAVVVASDVGGYFVGRFIGGPKIYRSISPKKTWAGSIGGVTLAIITAILIVSFFNYSLSAIIMLAFILAVSSQLGDVFQSWLKRKFNVKDSGFLLPGHGGLFDRLDGLLAAVPVYYGLSFLF